MNIFDIIIVILIISEIIVGSRQGVIRALASLIGLVVIFFVSFTFKGVIGNVLCKYLPFFKFAPPIDGLVSLNILIYQVIAFLIIISILYGVYKIFLKVSKLFQKLVNATVILELPSKILGALVASVEGYIYIFAILLILMIPLRNFPMFSSSKLVHKIVYETPVLSDYTGNLSNAMARVYDLADKLTNEELETNDANLQLIDSMLEYKIVTKKTVEQLVVLDKLKEVRNLESVLDKYQG